MKAFRIIAFTWIISNLSSCVTWIRDDVSEQITKGMVGGIIETKESSKICYSKNPLRLDADTNYFIVSASQKVLPENSYLLEKCPAGTRGRVLRFMKERDASQHIWNYVEIEMDDPRLKQKYRIIRMIGLRGDVQRTPWDKGGGFRVVSKQ